VARFFLSLSGVALLVGFTCWIGSVLGWWVLPLFWREVIFFGFAFTGIITYNLFLLRRKQPQSFVQFYLLSIILKMIIGLAFVFFLIWKSPTEIRGNVGLFLLTYLLFTLVEVFALMRKGNGKNPF
jgi:hypothetical protein